MRVERRKLLEYFRLLRRRQITTSDLVHVGGAARVHEHRAAVGNHVLDREVHLVGPAGDLPDSAEGRVNHDDVAGGEA